MSASTLTERIAQEFSSAARSLEAHASRRRSALGALQARGLPTTRDENWKYANLRSLERARFLPASAREPMAAAGDLDLPPALPGSAARYVFLDGRFAPQASTTLETAAGTAVLRLLSQGGEDGAAAAAAAPEADGRFALLNDLFATDGLGIDVRATREAPLQLEVLFLASAEAQQGSSYPRLELRLRPGTAVTLIERHLSHGSAASFVTSAVQVDVAAGARLAHYRLQELNPRTTLFDTLAARLGADAGYRLHLISSGAQSARSTLAVQLAGPRAELALAMLALGERQQVQDAYAVVEHAAPDARTVQTFRGIAAGRARVAFNGKIIVSPAAHGTDSRQSLRGLLAGPEAEIDVRPQLEIYTDEVRCSHGATAGKLDDSMLFYLLSRGLDRDAAQRLLKWAFLEDVISQVNLPALRRQIEERLAGLLHDEALRELL
ncbi:MAG TPA: SufD family Fe-S cluster assembly protein [Steroidobacteraceae bacterium]|nr:SufD family Fe-S cluster assembly protein [Steroidobacteraceae bacterium]